jgi:long-chain fatty acid transport protein
MVFKELLKYILILLAAYQFSSSVYAGTYGSDLNINDAPAAGGMAGVGYVRPQDPVAAVFGNPAALTQFKGSTAFTFGAAFLGIDADVSHDGSVTGTAWSAESGADLFAVPTIAVVQRVNEKLVLGGGFKLISGLGSDFRDQAAASLQPVTQFLLFGVNVDAAYEISSNLSIGVFGTLGIGTLEAGILGNTAGNINYGGRGGLGLTYDLGPAVFSATYHSRLSMTYENALESAPFVADDLNADQPQQIILGIATSDRFSKKLLLELNVIGKDWSSSDLYEDLYKDQIILAVGGQYKLGNLRPRLGYSYQSDIRNDDASGAKLGSFTTLNVAGTTTALSKPLLSYLQGVLSEAYWRQTVTVGIGYTLGNITLDANAGYSFDGEENLPFSGTQVDASIWQLGAGLTWEF